ncbi:MAG: NHL repeat-containing protein, partial [Gemmatimonadaceae bacterium]
MLPVQDAPTRQYLRLDGGWPAFELSGLEADDAGALSLARLPRPTDAVSGPLATLPGLDGPAGIAVAPCGAIYIADPAGHRILRIDSCGGDAEPLSCLGGPGSEPGRLDTPRGLVVGPRDALYIADSGNARVVVVDLATQQVRAVWGVPRSDPRPSDAPGGFVAPWDLAADRRGFVYVADPGAQDAAGHWSRGRVQKFRADGTVVAAFTEAMGAAAERPGAPVSVAVTLLDAGDRTSERLVVLDRQPARLLVFALDGTLDAAATALWSHALGDSARPTAVAAADGG